MDDQSPPDNNHKPSEAPEQRHGSPFGSMRVRLHRDGLPSDDEISWKFNEAIDQGTWPVEIDYWREPSGPGAPLSGGTRRLPDSHDHFADREFAGCKITVQFGRGAARDMMLEQFHRLSPEDPARPTVLCLLCRIDRECFLKIASQHLVATLDQRVDGPGVPEWLGRFVQELHELDTGIVVNLVDRTQEVDPRTGRRLRTLVLDLLDDARWQDEIGFLSAASLREQLET